MNINKPIAGMAALLCAAGLMIAGTTGAQAAEPRASDLPTQIVNGDLEYKSDDINRMLIAPTGRFIDAEGLIVTKDILTWESVPGFKQSDFGWKSNDSFLGHDSLVEIQRKDMDPGNLWVEIAAASQGKYIYQDVSTIPGAVYTWHLDHASRKSGINDSMQVLIGAPGHETAQLAERTVSNGLGDQTGDVGDVITTHGTAENDQWETYEGTYVVPEGQTITRFTFRSVADDDQQGAGFTAEGNCIDNIGFTISWPLTYSLNGGQGAIPNKEAE